MLWPDTHGPLDIYKLANSRQCKSIRSKMLINTTNIYPQIHNIIIQMKNGQFFVEYHFKIKLTSVKFSTKWRPALITMPLYMTTGRLYKLLSMRSESKYLYNFNQSYFALKYKIVRLVPLINRLNC